MTTDELTTASPAALRDQLRLLERERATAALSALADSEVYLTDLLNELAAVRSAYVGAAVSEIATPARRARRALLG